MVNLGEHGAGAAAFCLGLVIIRTQRLVIGCRSRGLSLHKALSLLGGRAELGFQGRRGAMCRGYKERFHHNGSAMGSSFTLGLQGARKNTSCHTPSNEASLCKGTHDGGGLPLTHTISLCCP